jgi:sigma-B regulation protein RsbU (phosphoserine phosphatase)
VLTLAPDEQILLYSDGAYEQPSPSGERFGRERLMLAASAHAGSGSESLLEHLVRTLAEWRGSRPVDDDVSLLAIDHRGGVRPCPARV